LALVLIFGTPLLAIKLCPSLVQRAANSASLSLSALNISFPHDSTPLTGPSQPQVIHLSADFALASFPLSIFPLPVLLTRATLSLELVPTEPTAPTLAWTRGDMRQEGARGAGGGGGGACVVGHTTLAGVSMGEGVQRVDSDVLLEDGAQGCFSKLAAALLRDTVVTLRLRGAANVTIAGMLPFSSILLNQEASIRGMGGLGAASISSLDLSSSSASALRLSAALQTSNPSDVAVAALGVLTLNVSSPSGKFFSVDLRDSW
jgi:hypothetical protein